MAKNYLVIFSHPNKKSFNNALGNAYLKGLKDNGHKIKTIQLYDLDFDLKFQNYKNPIERDLLKAQKEISWADHITFVYPIWWSNIPAILKSFLEKILHPGFGFKYKKGNILQSKLLKNKTANCIATMDSPTIYYKLIMKKPDSIIMKNSVEFCGIKFKGVNYFGNIRKTNDTKKENMLKQAFELGLNSN